MKLLHVILLTCLGTAAAVAADYHVDFDHGDDDRDGLAPERAFKRSPGDNAAKGRAAAVSLQPGDRVLFKGGVVYRGGIWIKKTSGTAGQPIIFDGSSWGEGQAIIDGGKEVTGWKRCASEDEAKGNPLWADIFYADVPKPKDWRSLNLCDANSALPSAQHPNPADFFWQDDSRKFLSAPTRLRPAKDGKSMAFTDAKNLSKLAGDDGKWFNGMTFAFHGGPNTIQFVPVLGYDPGSGTLSLGKYGGAQYKETKYCLFNSVRLIDKPGEYSVQGTADPKVSRVFLLPVHLDQGLPADISVTVREFGFATSEASHVTIQGFLVRRQTNCSIRLISPGSNIIIRDCETSLARTAGIYASKIDGVTIERCHIHDNPGHSKGIILHTCTDAVTRDCRLIRNTSTALDYYGCIRGQVVGNIVQDNRGLHANGLTFYIGCKDILVERNLVCDGNNALTFQQGENFIFRNNVFDGGMRSMVVGIWPAQPLKNVEFSNNTIVRGSPASAFKTGLFTNSKKIDGLVIRNNIIDGVSGGSGVFRPEVFSNNLFTRQAKPPTLGKDAIFETDLKKIFVDPDKGDFRLRDGSPAIGAGIDIGLTDDFTGKPRPTGRTDIGAYAFR